MRVFRAGTLAALSVVLIGGTMCGCGGDDAAGGDRRNGVSRDQAEAVVRRLECPGEEARRIECTPARAGWACVYGSERKTVTVTEPDPETGTLC